jgi:magnesium transporter
MKVAAALMTPAVPIARPKDTVSGALTALRKRPPEEASHLYLVDEEGQLVGQVPVETLVIAPPDAVLDGLKGDPPVEVHPEDRAETAALLAVERHEADVAVVDAQRRLLGAIPIGRLLAQLHEEHVDDFLRLGGVGTAHPSPTEAHETFGAFRARMPWLLIGLAGGFLAGGIASMFESALQQEIAIAFFLPLVVYMADAVGTQTETVLVRALSYGKVSLSSQLMREGALGLLIGATIGGMATLGLLIFEGRGPVAIVVGLTLTATAVIATIVASLLPWALARMGADPALASGPIATVVQDLLSVAVYLGIATMLL